MQSCEISGLDRLESSKYKAISESSSREPLYTSNRCLNEINRAYQIRYTPYEKTHAESLHFEEDADYQSVNSPINKFQILDPGWCYLIVYTLLDICIQECSAGVTHLIMYPHTASRSSCRRVGHRALKTHGRTPAAAALNPPAVDSTSSQLKV